MSGPPEQQTEPSENTAEPSVASASARVWTTPSNASAYSNSKEPRISSVFGNKKNKSRAEQIAGELSSSIVICGDPLDEKILKEANIEEAETVFALTDDDEDNIMACVLAEKYTPSKRTIAIIHKHNYNLLQESLKIDDLVDPRMATVSTIMKHVHMGTIDTVYSLLDGQYEFLEAKILETSELVNKSIKDSSLPEEVRIGAIVRKNKVMMPSSKLVFEKDDIVVVLSKREQLKEVEDIFRITS